MRAYFEYEGMMIDAILFSSALAPAKFSGALPLRAAAIAMVRAAAIDYFTTYEPVYAPRITAPPPAPKTVSPAPTGGMPIFRVRLRALLSIKLRAHAARASPISFDYFSLNLLSLCYTLMCLRRAHRAISPITSARSSPGWALADY